MFFHELSVRQTIDIHGLYRDCFSRRRDVEKLALVSAPHSEPRGDLVGLSHHLLESPLNIGEPSAHHPDDREISSRTAHRLGATRNMKYRVGRNEFLRQALARGVNELQE